jgi:ferritin-like metal-binding protein YciE
MLDQCSDEELKGLLPTHIDESVQQAENLEQVFSQMGRRCMTKPPRRPEG